MLRWLASLFTRKSGPPAERPSVASGFLDAHRLRHAPAPRERALELKGLVSICARLDAGFDCHARASTSGQGGSIEP